MLHNLVTVVTVIYNIILSLITKSNIKKKIEKLKENRRNLNNNKRKVEKK